VAESVYGADEVEAASAEDTEDSEG
jgi:hypothetical protein